MATVLRLRTLLHRLLLGTYANEAPDKRGLEVSLQMECLLGRSLAVIL